MRECEGKVDRYCETVDVMSGHFVHMKEIFHDTLKMTETQNK